MSLDTLRSFEWRRPLRVVLIAGPALWMLFTVVHLVVSGRYWWWRPADLLPPPIFLAMPVLLALAAVRCRRSRRPALVLCAGALAIGAPLSGLNLGGLMHADRPIPPGAVRVVSWNTEYWYETGQSDRFYALLRAQRADVYLLQEYLRFPGRPVRIDDIARLRAEFPGYQLVNAGELITLSAYPIVARQALDAPEVPLPPGEDFPEYWRQKTLRTDISVGGRVLSVYNVHMPAPVSIGEHSVFSAPFWYTIRNLNQNREAHLRALAQDVASNRLPILVAGDMNITPVMGDRLRFPAGLRDAIDASRSLYPETFRTWWRLDWVLVSPEVTVDRYEFRDPATLSDHRLQTLVVSL